MSKSIPNRHFITLLKNHRLELRQIFSDQNTVTGFELGNRTQCHVFDDAALGQSSWALPLFSQPVLCFYRFHNALKALSNIHHQVQSLKQRNFGHFYRNLLTGPSSNEIPRYPRHVRCDRSLGRRASRRDRLGSDNAVQMVGRTKGLGAPAEVVHAGAISEPINATNCHQTTVCPVVERITHPARARRSARRVRSAKDNESSKCSAKKSSAKRGGGGRSRAGRRRRDRSLPVENFSHTIGGYR